MSLLSQSSRHDSFGHLPNNEALSWTMHPCWVDIVRMLCATGMKFVLKHAKLNP